MRGTVQAIASIQRPSALFALLACGWVSGEDQCCRNQQDCRGVTMLPWGKWVIMFGTIFNLEDWDQFEEIATIGGIV